MIQDGGGAPVTVLVGYGHAPRGLGVGGGGRQVPGEPRVDGPDAGDLGGPASSVQQGGQRDGQGHPPAKPGPDSPGTTRAEPGWPGPRRPADPAIAAGPAASAASAACAPVTSRMPAISSAVSSSSPGGGPSGSGYSSGSNGSSSAPSQASRSSSVLGSGQVITAPSHPRRGRLAGAPDPAWAASRAGVRPARDPLGPVLEACTTSVREIDLGPSAIYRT